jgi:hypothetical protein
MVLPSLFNTLYMVIPPKEEIQAHGLKRKCLYYSGKELLCQYIVCSKKIKHKM